MAKISFSTTLSSLNSCTLLSLPKAASEKLPSRGMVMVEGTLNGYPFQSPLEPDGEGSHWCMISHTICEAIRAGTGDSIEVSIEPMNIWPEPDIPPDLKRALADSPQAALVWSDSTPMARWDWIRWIRSTKQAETRKKRIKTACDMLAKGKRRPCCFNRNLCTETAVSKNGILLK